MTEYVAIPDSDLEAGDGIKSEHALAFNNNVLAINEMDATALAAGAFPAGPWLIEDGAGGADPVYDFDTDGAVSSVTLPDFQEKFDYKIVIEELSSSVTSEIRIKWFLPELAANTTNYTILNIADGVELYGSISMDLPTRAVKKRYYKLELRNRVIADETLHDEDEFYTTRRILISNPTPTSIGHAEFSLSAGTFDRGKIWLFKRRRQNY